MVLTGECKKCFLNYVYGLGLQELLVYDVSYHSIIIEWLDSVGIYIEIGGLNLGQPEFYYNVQEEYTLNGMNGRTYPTRQEATQQAIKQANLIYNNKLKKNEQPFKTTRKFP